MGSKLRSSFLPARNQNADFYVKKHKLKYPAFTPKSNFTSEINLFVQVIRTADTNVINSTML